MAHALQGLGQLATGAILGRTPQILDILLRGHPTRTMLFSARKRKS
jgi:hypothetical protein